MMMMAHLSTTLEQEEVQSRCILLSDFRKAYDTMDQEFSYETLFQFGFDVHLIDLIRCIYTGTTARFVVNGSHSAPLQVRSGIRQGCPLAVEVLGLALSRTSIFVGYKRPGSPVRPTFTPHSSMTPPSFSRQRSKFPMIYTLCEHLALFPTMFNRQRVS